jgi:hypothetical protein
VYSYGLLNYSVEVDFQIPELPSVYSRSANNISITRGSPEIVYPEEVHRWMQDEVLEMSCHRNGDWYRLELPGQVVTHINTRNLRVKYETDEDTDAHTLCHFMIDQVLPRLIGHGGDLVLHGGCVSNGCSAIAFLGETGVGKSTLCASFAKDGWSVMSDDCLLIEAGPVATVRGAYSGLRLYPETISKLDMQDHPSSPMAGYSDKQRICLHSVKESLSRPLKLVVSLSEGDSLRLEEMNGADSLMDLVAGSFNLAPRDGSLAAVKVKQYAELIDGGLPMLSCRIPRDFSKLSLVKRALSDVIDPLK